MNFMVLDFKTGSFEAKHPNGRRDYQRGEYTVETVLKLNRDTLKNSRRAAYAAFTYMLKDYVATKESGASQATLKRFRDDILNHAHRTVWLEMQSCCEFETLFSKIQPFKSMKHPNPNRVPA